MKKRVSSIMLMFVFLITTKTFATHMLSGEIQFTHISGYTYQVEIITYTKISSPADRPELEINWGDGSSDTIPRTNGNGIPVATDVKKNIYSSNHTYPGPSDYFIQFTDQNRDAGIINITNSVNAPFSTQALLQIGSVFTNQHSARFLEMPDLSASLNTTNTYNVNAYDPDGDCLSYELVPCGGGGVYTYPNASNSFTIDSINGEIKWDAPISIGDYAIAVKVKEWRNGINIGYVIRDFNILVLPTPIPSTVFAGTNVWQVNANGNYSYTLAATDTLQLNLSYTDNTASAIDLNAYGETFLLNDTSHFTKSLTPSTINGSFEWTPGSVNVRSAPYVVTFRGISTNSPYQINNDVSLLIYVLDANTTPCFYPTSIKEPEAINTITISPNPSTGTFILSYHPLSPKTFFKMMDAMGRMVYTQTLTSVDGKEKINATGLSNGVYYYELVGDDKVMRAGKVFIVH